MYKTKVYSPIMMRPCYFWLVSIRSNVVVADGLPILQEICQNCTDKMVIVFGFIVCLLRNSAGSFFLCFCFILLCYLFFKLLLLFCAIKFDQIFARIYNLASLSLFIVNVYRAIRIKTLPFVIRC